MAILDSNYVYIFKLINAFNIRIYELIKDYEIKRKLFKTC